MQTNKGTRRGSSIFAASAAEEGDVSGPYGRPAYLYGRPDDNLLVDFPQRSQSGSKITESDSMHMQGDSQQQQQQYEYEQQMHYAQAAEYGSTVGSHYSTGKAKPRRSEAARMMELANSEDLPGGPNHRPLVGGFAAAAYEAAKAHHYSMKNQSDANKGSVPKDGPPPPSI